MDMKFIEMCRKYDECGVTLDLTICNVDELGLIALYKFDVPYGWLRMKVHNDFGMNIKDFVRENSFVKTKKIYEDALKNGLVTNYRMV